MLRFACKDLDQSYLPLIGLAAARIEVLKLKHNLPSI